DLSLYTDSTRYVIWGTSFAQLKGFVDDTHPEPDRYVVNAPLYAIVLAPALVVFPMSIVAAKTWTLILGACALFLFSLWLSKMLGDHAAILGTIVLAFNPLFVVISTEVLSETSFLALVFLMFLFFERMLREEEPSRGLLISFLLSTSLAVLLREVAITLLAALFLTMIVRGKAKYAFLMIACAASFLAVWMFRNLVLVGETASGQSSNIHFIFQHALTSPDAAFHEELWARLRSNAGGFGIQLAGMLLYPILPNLIVEPGDLFRTIVNNMVWGKFIVMGAAIPLMGAGVILDFKASPSALLRVLFLLFYFAVILTYPIHDIRFLLPALPFMIYYIARSMMWLAERTEFTKNMLPQRVAFAALLVVTLPNFAGIFEVLNTNLSYRSARSTFYDRIKKNNPEKTYFAASWADVGSWIQDNTPEDIVIASSLKEPATFIGNRRIIEMNTGIPLPTFETMLRDHHTTFLLASNLWADFKSYEFLMRESQRFRFEEVATIGNVSVFNVRSRYRQRTNERQEDSRNDTTAAGWLRKGRLEIVAGNYAEAIRSLERASEMQPRQPEPVFQLFLAHAFHGDSAKAIEGVRRMFTITRATPYIWAAQTHLMAMQHVKRVPTLRSIAQKSAYLFDVGRLYWNLGYPKAAYRTIREAVRTDSSYFVGLLWAWHFAIQTTDTMDAKPYLRTLTSIDRNNAVVRSFTAMTAFADTLRRTRIPSQRSRLRLMIAQEYDKMELMEEAIDETERAIGEHAQNTRAWLNLGALFVRKNKTRAAADAYKRLLELDSANVEARKFFSQSE
ncbi:MAG: tetratricopeptide repeat protein, partial [Ignavibacteriales bacterium]|nr:tetratricopeptide repeat protein [Ignavibacteriales bacterium]